MTQLFFKDKPLIGLDISQSSAKIIALSHKKTDAVGYSYVDLDEKKMQNIHEAQGHLRARLKEMMEKHTVGRITSSYAAVSVPTYRTFTRSVTLPKGAQDDLLGAIQIEAEQYIPVNMSELYIDYEIIETKEDSIEVLMSAVPKLYVDTAYEACRSVGISPIAIEPAMNSIARLIRHTESGELATIILDIGATSTDIAILDKAIRVTGGVDVGGRTMTQAIMKELKLTHDAAHMLRTYSGLNVGPKQDAVKRAAEPILLKIVAETKRVMRYYSERLGKQTKIEQLLIVGGGSNMPGLGDYFTENMVIAARVASPWQVITFGKLKPIPKALRPRFITAMGLGMVESREALK